MQVILTHQILCTNFHAEMPHCGEEKGELSGSGDSEDVLLSLPRTLKKGRKVVQVVRHFGRTNSQPEDCRIRRT